MEAFPLHIQKLLIDIDNDIPVETALLKLLPHLDKDISLYSILNELGFSFATNAFLEKPDKHKTIRLIT